MILQNQTVHRDHDANNIMPQYKRENVRSYKNKKKIVYTFLISHF